MDLIPCFSVDLLHFQFTVAVTASNSMLASEELCTIIVSNVPAPPYFVRTAFDLSQQTAFPGSFVGTIIALDVDGTSFASLCHVCECTR